MAEPQEAPSGPGNCGGAPTAIRGRVPSCRFAPSGPTTPGAKIRRAAITISRCGAIAARAATGSSATIISTILSSRSIITARRASPGAAARYSCIWPTIFFPRPRGKKIVGQMRSEEHTSELQSRQYLVCRLLLEKKKTTTYLLSNRSKFKTTHRIKKKHQPNTKKMQTAGSVELKRQYVDTNTEVRM